MILLVDFGSQTAHLIARRVKEFGVPVIISPPEDALAAIAEHKPKGIIFSGGPSSVYESGAPTVEKAIFSMGIPILGICYGQQLTAYLLGGLVKPGKTREYGPAMLQMNGKSPLFDNILDNHFRVWMSHGDEVVAPPKGFIIDACTSNVPVAAMNDEKRKIYCVQFHPEVGHTTNGTVILRNFIERVCGLAVSRVTVRVSHFVNSVKEKVGDGQVIAAVSGGVDSTVAAAVVARAIGKNLIPVFIDNGLMRIGAKELITNIFATHFDVPVIVLDARSEFLRRLKGVTDPEQKRRIIGNLYIEYFEREAKRHPKVSFLIQGTIYSDVIESRGTKHADKIKSHHNVGGLPEHMNLKLLEPLRELYKDEVRALGKKLGLPKDVLAQQPFPGPGQAIRIIGEVTEERLARQQQADQIVLEEMKKSGWIHKVFQSFPVLTDTKSTAVKGDGRFYGDVVAIRVFDSLDIMTASWTRLPYELMQRMSSRIVNEVPGVSRVVYDITTKPPATMEWE